MKKPNNIKKFFDGDCQFKIGAASYQQIPDSILPELAFVGKSNVGKSSLINALVGKKIAITSKTPGRTRQLNFFCLNNKLNLVDMPGFGYAKVSKIEIASWEKLTYYYFANRVNLKKVFLLIDARRGLGEKDFEIINIFNAVALNYQLVLTKIDQLKNIELEKVLEKIKDQTKKFVAQHPLILSTSVDKKIGIEKMREIIIDSC